MKKRRRKIVTVAGLVRSVAKQLKQAKLVFAHGTTDPVAEAAFIVAETLGIHPDHIEARAGMAVGAAAQKKIDALVARRIRTRKPAAYLLKRIYMQGVAFHIDERAIVPRSYLGEIMAGELFAGDGFSLVPKPDSVRRVLDLCTGSGCLAILAALRFAKAKVDAVELSKDALEVARKNVAEHRLKTRVRLLRGDLFAPVKSARYDLIIANPPYVDAEGMASLPPECRHEPEAGVCRWRRRDFGDPADRGRGRPPPEEKWRPALRGRPLPAGAGARLSGQAFPLARHRGKRRRGVLAGRRELR